MLASKYWSSCLAFVLNILADGCLQIDLDVGNMIKFCSIEHEILDLLDLIDPFDLLDPLDLIDPFDLLETNDNLQFKELINFMIFIDHARVSDDDEFTYFMDDEVMMK
jgi:hypothetical protein